MHGVACCLQFRITLFLRFFTSKEINPLSAILNRLEAQIQHKYTYKHFPEWRSSFIKGLRFNPLVERLMSKWLIIVINFTPHSIYCHSCTLIRDNNLQTCDSTPTCFGLLCLLLLFNPLNAKLNPICYLLAKLGAHPILHVSRIRVKSPRMVT
jgi:hypothetical protein